jgi:hypothetical protein
MDWLSNTGGRPLRLAGTVFKVTQRQQPGKGWRRTVASRWLALIDGTAHWEEIAGTGPQYVNNTSSDLFRLDGRQRRPADPADGK